MPARPMVPTRIERVVRQRRIHDLAYGLPLEHGADLSVKVCGREGFDDAAVAKRNPRPERCPASTGKCSAN